MTSTNDFNSQVSDVEEMTHTAKNLSTGAFFMSHVSFNESKYYNEIFERMFGGTENEEAKLVNFKEDVQDVFDYHFSKIKDMCKYIVSESNRGYDSEDFMQVTSALVLLGSLEVLENQTNGLIEHLTQDMSERLFVEYCENPI